MPRRPYKKRPSAIDTVYASTDVAKLINYVMTAGKKTVAQKMVYNALDIIKKENQDPVAMLKKALNNVSPTHEVRPRRVGGASYLVPSETRADRKIFLGFNWILQAARARPNKEYKSFGKKLAVEILAAASSEGEAVAKKKQVEKLAEANRAFAHFKW